MGSILHGNAKTTPRIRKEIQESKKSANVLAKELNLNVKTVLKWRKRESLEDKPSGPIKVKSSLTEEEQLIVCQFRRITLLPLDDVFIALKEKIPALTRSNCHRCLQRNGLSCLPKEETTSCSKKSFKEYPIGYVHIDITEVRTEEGKAYLFVGIDRTTKYVYVELHTRMTSEIASDFLEHLVQDCPFVIHTVLTDNGAQFTYALLAEHLRPKDKIHLFDQRCQMHGIDHRLTEFRHPWTNGQVEVTNKILKRYTTKNYHYQFLEELKQHLMIFVLYYNHQRKLRALKYKSPYQVIIDIYQKQPTLFKDNPNHKIMGLNK